MKEIHKIFVFFPCDGKIGGAERRLIRTFTYIKNSNKDFVFTIGLLTLSEINEDSVRKDYHAFTDLRIVFFHTQSEIFHHVKQTNYEIVCYTDCSYRCLPVLFGAKLGRKKRLMMCTDTMGSSQHLKPKLRQVLYNLDVRLANRIDCLYPSNTKLLQSKFKNKEITCTPCSFTDMEKYQPSFPKKKEIVFLGRLTEFKGITLFVNSMLKIADDIRKNGFKCYIYGHGDLEEQIREAISMNKCEDIIHCMGHISDSSKVLTNSMIFCSLQTLGNYPSQSMLEAMACGNYCIATNTYDSYLLIDNSFGQLIEQNEDDLAAAVLNAMNLSDEKFELISNNARNYLLKNHCIEKSADYFEDIFYELV